MILETLGLGSEFAGTEALAGTAALGGIMAIIAGFFLIALIIGLAIYIYAAVALMAIVKKTKTPNGWLAFIPIANIYLLTQMAGVNGLWTLIVLAPIIPFIGALAMGAVVIWMFWLIVEKIKYPGWTSLLMIIPIVNLVMLGVWAWAKK
ncbi:hypothetical protein J4481_02595 [Candidatus Pacearchaeota archaeon]|nr:hypothetical protein [Candidatus Pacearchaeota archaeon]